MDVSSILDITTLDHLPFELRAHSCLFARGVARGCDRDLLKPLKEKLYLSEDALLYVHSCLLPIFLETLPQALLKTIPAPIITSTVFLSRISTPECKSYADRERSNSDSSLPNALARLDPRQIRAGLSGDTEAPLRSRRWAVRSGPR